MPPELRRLFDDLNRLGGLAEGEMKALAEHFGRRLQRLASKMDSDPGADWDKLFEPESARFDALVQARLKDLRTALEAKLGPPDLLPPRWPIRKDLDRMPRRGVPGKRLLKPFGRLDKRPRKPPGRTPDAGGVPVKPDRPSGLSGGAAAPIEQD